jgi:hypothetical protein
VSSAASHFEKNRACRGNSAATWATAVSAGAQAQQGQGSQGAAGGGGVVLDVFWPQDQVLMVRRRIKEPPAWIGELRIDFLGQEFGCLIPANIRVDLI